MIVVPIQKEHVEVIHGWFDFYKIPRTPIPSVGFIAEEDGLIAAAFLRKIEGGFGLFDGLIANPESSGKRRSLALDAVVQRLKEEAARLEITKILAYSSDKAVVRRSLKHGFEMQPDVFIALAI